MRFKEFAIVEKKKRKRKKPRWAAYGPGPYGGYGYAVGYSGDGGGAPAGGDGGGGGVGEASYPGNIGAMELAKFFKIAGSKEKDLLKALINRKDYRRAWALVQGITGVKLQGREFQTDEGWKDTLAGLALGAGVAFGGIGDAEAHTVKKGDTVYSIAKSQGVDVKDIAKANKLDKNFTIEPGQKLVIPGKDKKPSAEKKVEKKKIDISKTLTGTTHEAVLTRTARAAGITDPTELAAFLAQCAHESHDFQSMVEYGGSLDFRKYDPKHAPKKARALGNKKVGDGARYKGRGYIQLTGRYNYKRAGEALSLPLEQKPELAEKPEIAAKIAVWFWKQRVQPNVTNFNDVRSVTKPINPGLNGLEDRKEAFIDFKKFKLASR